MYNTTPIVALTLFGGSSPNKPADVVNYIASQPEYTLLQLDTKNVPSLINHNSSTILGANNNSIISNTHNEKNNSVKSIADEKIINLDFGC